jgi:hypothetical protein
MMNTAQNAFVQETAASIALYTAILYPDGPVISYAPIDRETLRKRRRHAAQTIALGGSKAGDRRQLATEEPPSGGVRGSTP